MLVYLRKKLQNAELTDIDFFAHQSQVSTFLKQFSEHILNQRLLSLTEHQANIARHMMIEALWVMANLLALPSNQLTQDLLYTVDASTYG